MKRCVGLGIIVDNLIKIGRAMAGQALLPRPFFSLLYGSPARPFFEDSACFSDNDFCAVKQLAIRP